MLRRLSALVLVLTFLPTSAAAQSLLASAEREAKAIANQTIPAAKNPYKTPAIVLMAGGAGLLILGLMQDRGAEVSTGGSGVSVKETGGSKTALTVLGISAAAAGAGLWFWGENKKNSGRFSISPTQVSLQFAF